MAQKLVIIATVFCLVSCHEKQEHKTVICIPVYGQSLALGEEAERITDFDSLAAYANGRIVTERLDHSFGYFDNDDFRRFAKRALRYQKRSFELSIYQMARQLADKTGSDTLICIFPGGQGGTALTNLGKGTTPYREFIESIQTAYEEATSRGWSFFVPAICWMQGESDIVDYPDTDYRQLLTQIWADMNRDVRHITQQADTIAFICYQANVLTRAPHFIANEYECRETAVPMAFVQLLQSNQHFWASGPTYPYHCVRDALHIDAQAQQSFGTLAARSALGILHGAGRFQGLIPTAAIAKGHEVVVHLNVPTPPLTFDTQQVRKAHYYGFSVVNRQNQDITIGVFIEGDSIRINCSELAHGSKVRYAVNGEPMKSGNRYGPRGNLRDAGGNWCYQFEIETKR